MTSIAPAKSIVSSRARTKIPVIPPRILSYSNFPICGTAATPYGDARETNPAPARMLIDARSLEHGAALEADICVIGSGAAGITLARDFIGRSHRVILLESGPFDFDDAANELNEGRSVGRPYSDLSVCRQRFYGGTTNHWGGWCLPQEPIDFERGWPFPRTELDPYYERAQEI